MVAGAGPLQQPVEWNGPVLGGEGKLLFDGISTNHAQLLIHHVIAEIDRLEAIFSLHRNDSEISRLNDTGRLKFPSQDMRNVMSAAMQVWQQTNGLFNPAIQPLWQHLAQHFAHPSRGDEPRPDEIATVLKRCDPAQIEIRGDAIRLAPGMALTFNGIAQGYIADRVVDILKGAGLGNALVQLGETRALPGRYWPISANAGRHQFALQDAAVATSAGAASLFSPDGRWHHLVNPITGQSPGDLISVTVRAGNATTADALSTALAVAPVTRLSDLITRFSQTSVAAQMADGRILAFGRPWQAGFRTEAYNDERRS